MITDYHRLSGLQKVAILFSILGESLAITLIENLSKTDKRKIRAMMREMENTSFSVKKRVTEEFYFSFVSEEFQKEENGTAGKPFEFLDNLSDEQLVALISPEEPRVIAIVLAQISLERRTLVLKRMKPEEKGRTLIELGNLSDIPLEAVVNVATELKEKSSFLPRTLDFSRGGGKDIADILSTMGQDEEDKFLSAISLENPELAKEVKKYHLTFENIFEFFPDNLIRDIMNSVDLDDIATALKGMSEEDVNRVINNLPKKKQAMYEPKEGAMSKREIERARKKIVEQARIMEKDGAFSLQDLTGSGEMVE